VLTSSGQVSKPAGAKDEPKALPSATAAKTTLHNPIRQTPSLIKLAACQEAGDVRGAVPRPAVPGRLDPVERIGVAAAQKRRPAGRLGTRCRQAAGNT
jgi:hypothetical protein